MTIRIRRFFGRARLSGPARRVRRRPPAARIAPVLCVAPVVRAVPVVPFLPVLLLLPAFPLIASCGAAGQAVTAETTISRPGTAIVSRGTFVRSIRFSGTVEAMQSYIAMTPRLTGPGMGTLVVTKLAPSGARVRRGDVLVEFDRQSQLREALDRRNEYLGFEAQIRRKQAEQRAALVSDETQLQQAVNAVERARLELLKNEMLSAIAAEKNQQVFEEAEARLTALRETFDLKRAAAAADLRILEIQRDRARAAMEHAERNASQMTILSPLDGLVVPKQIYKGGQMGEVQEGEQVRPGVPILEVVSATGMQVRVRANQLDAQALEVGQAAEVRLDAYPDKLFKARLEQLAPIALPSDMSPRVRNFVAIFSIEGSDDDLMPDLTAAVDVEIERLDDALLVPRHAVARSGEGWTVRVLENGSEKVCAVDVVAMSENEAAIGGGIAQGAVVVTGAPREKL